MTTIILPPSMAEEFKREYLNPVYNRGGLPFPMGSLPIIESPHAYRNEQFRFPKSKRRRVRKKWSKRSINWRRVPQAYIANLEFEPLWKMALPIFGDER